MDRSGVRNTPACKKGIFASFSRYFKITLPIISSHNFLPVFPAYFLENMKNTAFLCGVFRLHLFWRHRLVRLTGVEPVRPSGHKHLKLASLPIPAQPQSTVIFRPLGYYTVLATICQRFFQVFMPSVKVLTYHQPTFILLIPSHYCHYPADNFSIGAVD